jgi:hypothetical protein
VVVEIVAARHSDDFEGRCEHVVEAEGAVGVSGVFYTGVGSVVGYGDADVAFLARLLVDLSSVVTLEGACLAVDEVFAETFTPSAYPTIWTVVYAFARIVVP